MIRNYFKIAWRNLLKNKLFSLINIVGLGLAIPFALLSLMQVQSAFEFDNFHPETERIYRVTTQLKSPTGEITKYGSSPLAVANNLKENYPFVEKATHTAREFGWELTNRIKTIQVNSLFVEPEFFELFAFPLQKGNLPEAPNSIVLSQEMAHIFFGDSNPIGKTLSHHDYGEFTITGVLKPYKKNTHLRSDVLVSMATYNKHSIQDIQVDLTGYTYVKLKTKENREDLDAALATITGKTNELLRDREEKRIFQSQAFTRISPDFEELEDNPYVESLRDLSVNFFMALAIILLAGFNYTNLTLARSLNRAKEVGIRKVSGASRNQLVVQFICESIVIALFALVIGFFILKVMEQFITVNWITWEVDNYLILWSVFIVFTIFTGAIAGIIPARILSRFSPAKVLKGNLNPASFGKIGFRKSLVVVQFVVTACFIFLIANMFSQFNYMATDNENFNRKGIYNISVQGDPALLANDIATHKNVESIGFTSAPFGGTSMTAGIKKEKLEENIGASYYAVDAGFINNMELELIAGENIPETSGPSSSNFVVVNEKTLYTLGMGEPLEAIGKTIILNEGDPVTIKGVVKDFCYYIYQFDTRPLVLQYNPEKFQVLSIRTKGNFDEAVFRAEMGSIWKKHHPYEDIAISNYQEELYERYYPGADMKFMGMVCLSIFIIAIMGLLGIVTYTTEKRFKEIGIRKVMGASVKAIVKELSAGFFKLLMISAAICLPLGYLISYLFINIFAFNDGVAIGLMLLLFSSILFIALVVIGIQSAKAAMANPVKILRTE